MSSNKKLADASKQFTPQQIAASIAEGKRQRDLQNGRDRKAGQTVGRNDYCPCGSGLKNKHCHNATVVKEDGKNFAVAAKQTTSMLRPKLYKKVVNDPKYRKQLKIKSSQ